MTVWQVVVKSKPEPRGEKRVTFRSGGRTINRLADKPAVAEYKAFLRQVIESKAPSVLLDGPLSLKLVICRERPKSTPKRELYPTKMPDLTNYLKPIEDCLKGLVITDDARIVDSHQHKRFAPPGQAPFVAIRVSQVTWPPDLEELGGFGVEVNR